MFRGISITGVYVRDLDEAIGFYTTILGFRLHTDARMGDYRWVTVQVPGQELELALWLPESPMLDAASSEQLRALVAKGALPSMILHVDDCRATHAALVAKGVEFTQEPMDRFYGIDAAFRDPSGNHWRMTEPKTTG